MQRDGSGPGRAPPGPARGPRRPRRRAPAPGRRRGRATRSILHAVRERRDLRARVRTSLGRVAGRLGSAVRQPGHAGQTRARPGRPCTPEADGLRTRPPGSTTQAGTTAARARTSTRRPGPSTSTTDLDDLGAGRRRTGVGPATSTSASPGSTPTAPQRTGDPEVVYGAGKTPQQVIDLLRALRQAHPDRPALATRLTDEALAAVAAEFPVGRRRPRSPAPASSARCRPRAAGSASSPPAPRTHRSRPRRR